MVFGLAALAFEWPLPLIAGRGFHRYILTRLIIYPANAVLVALLYQGTDPAAYYLLGIILYFWAYTQGEEVCEKPWTLPKKGKMSSKA